MREPYPSLLVRVMRYLLKEELDLYFFVRPHNKILARGSLELYAARKAMDSLCLRSNKNRRTLLSL